MLVICKTSSEGEYPLVVLPLWPTDHSDHRELLNIWLRAPSDHQVQLFLQQHDGVVHICILCHFSKHVKLLFWEQLNFILIYFEVLILLPFIEYLQLLDDHLSPLLVINLDAGGKFSLRRQTAGFCQLWQCHWHIRPWWHFLLQSEGSVQHLLCVTDLLVLVHGVLCHWNIGQRGIARFQNLQTKIIITSSKSFISHF